MRLNLILLSALTATLGLFQNCGQTLRPNGDTSPSTITYDARMVDTAAGYDKITYDPMLEVGDIWGNYPARLDIDLNSGTLEVLLRTVNQKRSCALDTDRLNALRDLMNSASICKPGPLPPDTAVCMAIALADVRLSNGTQTIDLRPVTCHNGTFLCGDADQKLRDLLMSLRDQAPAGCN